MSFLSSCCTAPAVRSWAGLPTCGACPDSAFSHSTCLATDTRSRLPAARCTALSASCITTSPKWGFTTSFWLGYSLGGALALSYASAYPEQVTGLITISCGDQFEMPEGLLGKLRKPADTRKSIEIFSQTAFHPAFPQAERRTLLAPMKKTESEVLLADFSIGAEFCFNKQSPRLKFPSLFIGGSNDLISPPASLHRASRYFERSTVSFIEKAGHMVVYEKNEELRDKVSKFLARFNKWG